MGRPTSMEFGGRRGKIPDIQERKIEAEREAEESREIEKLQKRMEDYFQNFDTRYDNAEKLLHEIKNYLEEMKNFKAEDDALEFLSKSDVYKDLIQDEEVDYGMNTVYSQKGMALFSEYYSLTHLKPSDVYHLSKENKDIVYSLRSYPELVLFRRLIDEQGDLSPENLQSLVPRLRDLRPDPKWLKSICGDQWEAVREMALRQYREKLKKAIEDWNGYGWGYASDTREIFGLSLEETDIPVETIKRIYQTSIKDLENYGGPMGVSRILGIIEGATGVPFHEYLTSEYKHRLAEHFLRETSAMVRR